MDARFWSGGKWYTIPGVADSLTDGVPGIALAGGYTEVTAPVTPPPNGDIYQPLYAEWKFTSDMGSVLRDVDLNNDGVADHLVMSGHSSNSLDQPFTGWWASYASVDESTGVVSYLPWVQVSNEGWSDLSKTAFVDANGDGLTDVVRADGSDWKVNYNGYGQSPTNGYVFTAPTC